MKSKTWLNRAEVVQPPLSLQIEPVAQETWLNFVCAFYLFLIKYCPRMQNLTQFLFKVLPDFLKRILMTNFLDYNFLDYNNNKKVNKAEQISSSLLRKKSTNKIR